MTVSTLPHDPIADAPRPKVVSLDEYRKPTPPSSVDHLAIARDCFSQARERIAASDRERLSREAWALLPPEPVLDGGKMVSLDEARRKRLYASAGPLEVAYSEVKSLREELRDLRLSFHAESNAPASTIEQMTFAETNDVLRALRRIPFASTGEPLYELVDPIWRLCLDHLRSIDPYAAHRAVNAAMLCRPKYECSRPRARVAHIPKEG